MAGLSSGEIQGLVVGVIFGSIFLITCVISAVKAVRDRRRILERRAAKKAARTNGHIPGAPAAAPEKKRPQILIIHDDERAKRITGSSHRSRSESPRSDFSTPGISRHTETTYAEMAYNHSDPVNAHDNYQYDDEDGATSQPSNDSLHNGHCRSDGSSDSYVESACLPRSKTAPTIHEVRRGHANRNQSNSTPDMQQQWKMSVIAEDGSDHGVVARNGRVKPAVGMTSSNSLNGISRRSNSSPIGSYPPRKEYVCAKYNPRRNSYAAAIANPAWIELPPLRRHSDESRHLAPCVTREEPYARNPKLRDRGRSQEGADNPAFDSADDSVAL